jgi:FtsP/CotA-like multicopper oxidase with cupredoxin domain
MSNGMKFIQIGSDGGFLSKPVELTSLLLAPAERADILVDFSDINPGTTILLRNDAKAPFPDGDSPDPDTVGQIMQFSVPINSPQPVEPTKLPYILNCITKLKPNAPARILTLNEAMGPNGPTMVLLNGQMWSAPITETPKVGSTEEWCIVNLTMDSHPIHLHLVQFQLLDRQNFKAEEYKSKWEELNGMVPLHHKSKVLPIEPYLLGKPEDPEANEKGWKDTVRMNPGQVTRIVVRFAPQDIPTQGVSPGENYYPFDPSSGPGYVWHCHILDHEDNEMMRPYKVEPK